MYDKNEAEGMVLLEECVDMSDVDLIYTNTKSVFLALRLAKKHGIPCVAHLREFATANDDSRFHERRRTTDNHVRWVGLQVHLRQSHDQYP